MTEWSKHVHRFAKKHNMSYKEANVSKKCKEDYKKRMSESLKNLMNYDYSNMPHNFMYKFLKDRL